MKKKKKKKNLTTTHIFSEISSHKENLKGLDFAPLLDTDSTEQKLLESYSRSSSQRVTNCTQMMLIRHTAKLWFNGKEVS